MAMAIFRKIDKYSPGNENFTDWIERREQWYIANTVSDVDRKRALLLSFIGASSYKLIRSLAQNKPMEKTYEELTKLMRDH